MEPGEGVCNLGLDFVVDDSDIFLELDDGGKGVSYTLSYRMEISMRDIEG